LPVGTTVINAIGTTIKFATRRIIAKNFKHASVNKEAG
jgi:uncharacterized protein YejL (UPF0352 family)